MRGGRRLGQRHRAAGLAHAIGVLDRIMQRHRAGGVGLRRIEQPDGRRRPRLHFQGHVGGERAAVVDFRFAVLCQREPPLLRGFGRRRRQPALNRDADDAGIGAHDQRGIFGRGERPRDVALADLQENRRLAGVGGGVDPGVDARAGGLRQRRHAVKRRREAREPLRPRREERDRRQQHRGKAQRIGIARRYIRRGRLDPEPRDLLRQPLLVQRPEGLGGGIVVGVGERVLDRGSRPVGRGSVTVEPFQRARPAGPAQPQQRAQRRQQGQREQPQRHEPRQGRRRKPEAEPGSGGEQQRDHAGIGQRRPQPLPDEGQRRPAP